MFSDIHHVSYLVPDLDAAIESYARMYRAVVTGRGAVANLGEVAFLRAGGVEVEFIRPEGPGGSRWGAGTTPFTTWHTRWRTWTGWWRNTGAAGSAS